MALAERTRWTIDPDTGCWVWQLHRNDRGYGQLSINHTERVYAHRWSYEQHVGPIPASFEVHHVCRNKACVNPEHLTVLTPEAHRLEHLAPTCGRGHVFDEANTRVVRHRDGYEQRRCRECERATRRRYLARQRARKAVTA